LFNHSLTGLVWSPLFLHRVLEPTAQRVTRRGSRGRLLNGRIELAEGREERRTFPNQCPQTWFARMLDSPIE
jgi:hypothetical protein